MQGAPIIHDSDFDRFRQWLRHTSGVNLAPGKKALVAGRLTKRLAALGLSGFRDYFRLVMEGRDRKELMIALDLLTTHETYFFREPKHFDFLFKKANEHRNISTKPLRVWCAAASTGEEAYTVAMVLAMSMGFGNWHVVASDISVRVVEEARLGLYPIERANKIPKEFLSRYCLRGVGPQSGKFLIDSRLREHMEFLQVNLNAAIPPLGEFDWIFLRNVMIYFDTETKQQVIDRLLRVLRPNGYLIIGHAETLHGITDQVYTVTPSIYRKVAAVGERRIAQA